MKQEERIIRVKKPAYAKETGWMTEVPPRKATGKWIKQVCKRKKHWTIGWMPSEESFKAVKEWRERLSASTAEKS